MTFSKALLSMVLCAVSLWSQQTSGSISGVVQDQQGGVVPGARVVLTDQLQGSTRQMTTTAEGTFVFTPLQPAPYTLSVEMPGFRKYVQQDIRLHANDRLALPPVSLAIGSLGEAITVEANPVQLQAQSAERAGVITGSQVLDIAINGRSFMALLKTVPGTVADVNSINGQRTDQNNLTVDGVTAVDAGSNSMPVVNVNIDAIAEFKVLTNGQQAEFGKSAGAFINVVTRSGSREFRGVGYWFHRHEGLNANNWRNNADGLARPLYRFNTQGFNVSGPVYIPGRFNVNRDKLFFFIGQDWHRQLSLPTLRIITMPTQAERQGDFSLTHEADGSRVTIKDPTTGQPFPANQIPASRFHPDGAKILSFFPLPNVQGRPNYNYQSQIPGVSRPYEGIYRFDYNITPGWRAYFRFVRNFRDSNEPYCSEFGNNCSNNLGLGRWDTTKPSHMIMGNVTTIISPTFTNEFITGRSVAHPQSHPMDDAYSREKLGLSFRQLYPDADPLKLVPNFVWGGVPNAPSTNFYGLPYFNTPASTDFTDNLAKVFPAHTVKAGVFMLWNIKDQVSQAYVTPRIAFDRDSLNPGDTGWAFSNALLGNFQSYYQDRQFPTGYYRFYNIEWYLQDNWKVNRTLTLDYGMRFYLIPPWYESRNQVSTFNRGLYDGAHAVTLYRPGFDASGRRAAVDPRTGATAPAVMIGAIVPGSGDIDNGMATGGVGGYPDGMIENRGLHYAPRIGLAWNPGSANKTVLRVGGGIFYDRVQGNPIFYALGNPPLFRNSQLFYGNLSTISSAQEALFPSRVRGGMSRDGKVATTYNWNFSIQRELPFGVLLDVGYVGSIARHLVLSTAANDPAFGSAWLPENQDPTAGAPRTDGSTTVAINLTRPYQGYADIGIYSYGGSSNFNSLQVSATRRMQRGLQFGLTYMWSKALGVSPDIGTTVHPLDSRKADYGPLSFDRTQNLVVNYIYALPAIPRSGLLDNPVARLIFNGWQVSGISAFTSGAPGNIGYSVRGVGTQLLNRRITGSESWAPRVVVTGNPNLAPGDRTVDRFVDAGVFRPALRGSTGIDSGPRIVRGPGINNWDISVFKNIPWWKGEQRFIQLRVEMFNAFNHTQFSDFNRSIQFDASGNITNLPASQGGGGGTYGFGAMTSARTARIIQIAAKVYF